MAPPQTDRELFRPTLPHLLIALFLAKSRPSNVSVHEHVQSLRACAKAGRRLEDSSTGHHHIDTSAFWRDAFRKSEETQNELRARIFELEQTLEAQNGPSSLTPIQATSQKKRKRMASKVGDGDSAIAVKRPRVAGMEQKSQGQDESLPFLVGDVLMPLADPKASIFLHHFYLLRQLTARKTPGFKALATALRQILSDIVRIVSSSGIVQDAAPRKSAEKAQRQNSAQAQLNMGQELDIKLTAIARVFPYLLQSLHSLCERAEGQPFQGLAIYSFIQVFRDLLHQIFTLSISQTQATPTAPSKPARNPRSRTIKQAPAPPPTSSPSVPNKTIFKLCNFFLALSSALDPSKRSDNAILEGLLFFLLTRTGTALKIFVFEHDYPEDFLPIPNPRPRPPSSDYETSRRHAEAHAPYLIYLLARLVPPQTNPKSRRVSDISLPPPTPPPPPPPPPTKRLPATIIPPRRSLASIPSSTLQSTLLRAVFGAGTGSSDDFADALSPPLAPEDENNGDDDEDAAIGAEMGHGDDVGDWFRAEVWRIVGWGVLGGGIAW